MNSEYAHLYLYAKNHYRRTDMIMDLRRIVAHRAGCRVEHVDEHAVATVVSEAVMEHLLLRFPRPEDRRYLTRALAALLVSAGVTPNRWLRQGAPESALQGVCRSCLEYLCGASVLTDGGERLLTLGAADPEVLPLALTEAEERAAEDVELHRRAVSLCTESRRAGAHFLRTHLHVPHGKAEELLERLQAEGVVGPKDADGYREVLAARQSHAPAIAQ